MTENTETVPQADQSPPEATHFLVERQLLQATVNYLSTRPAGEVVNFLNALVNNSTGVTVVPKSVVNEDQVSS